MTLYQILSICGVPSLIVAIIISGVNIIKMKHSSNRLIKEALLAILHNKIYTLGTQHIAEGHITISDLNDFEHLYRAYHALGGNGTGTEVYQRVKKLQMKEKGD